MAEWRPYFLTDRITFGTAGTGTLSLDIGATEAFEGHVIIFYVSSGTFVIEKIYDESGTPYTNADSSNPIHSANFLTTLSQKSKISVFPVPLQIPPTGKFKLYITGGTNTATLDCLIVGKIKPA